MRITAVSLVAIMGLATVAEAYVIPAEFVARMLISKRRGQRLKDISVQLTSERKDRKETVDVRIYLKTPERMRWVEDEGESLLRVEREGARATGTEGSLKRDESTPRDLQAVMMVPPQGRDYDERSARMVEVWKAAGIDTSIVALGRFDGRPAYIVGARVWEPEKPQVWIDKESFLPVRTVLLAGKAKSRKETRFLEYGSSVAGTWYPRVTEIYVNDELFQRSEVVQVQVNQSLPETMFELP